MLEGHPARYPLPSTNSDRPGRIAEGLPTALSGGDVFRVRRRIPDRGLRGAGARLAFGQCARRCCMSAQENIVVSGGFDDLRSRHLRFLEEASKAGPLPVLLWPDELVQARTGQPPKFPLSERLYFLEAVRYVGRVLPLSTTADVNTLPEIGG